MITARAGLRIVQQRVSHLRRAVVAEVEDINRLIYHVLRAGVIVSVAILVFGFVLVAFTGHSIPDRSIPPRALGQPLYTFTPEGYLSLGVLILILILSVLFANKIVGPIQKLEAGTEAIAKNYVPPESEAGEPQATIRGC